ncbi:MAG: hypothetical protein ACLRY6_23190 [[Clostridium] innocuum]|uniref:hypothetical protein n=1 Tax=Clostridium innocuum TaxID=1522 RepID=UPI0015F66E77|nr:hypothetical protein [[Clostridium] innocuum]MBV4069976.1 hypothetical protein [[Clostridium] innocuum]MCC2838131.1 hypothetical protein [[Clostridium] innocuum]MCR0241808.1 hypothetical protein [[Clostridium] innocuum]MCR0441688.1 hypothetical protein [[Clostridium] innocuum]
MIYFCILIFCNRQVIQYFHVIAAIHCVKGIKITDQNQLVVQGYPSHTIIQIAASFFQLIDYRYSFSMEGVACLI